MFSRKRILVLSLLIFFVLVATDVILPPRFKYASFRGNETFRFCGLDITGFHLKYQGDCERFCEYITGTDCKDIRSKAQQLEGGTCYGYPPQVMLGDPCDYCSVQCEGF